MARLDVPGLLGAAAGMPREKQQVAEGVAFLTKALPRLPGAKQDRASVTVDLNGQAVLRARAEGQGQVTEVVLAQSDIQGKAVRLNLDRDFRSR